MVEFLLSGEDYLEENQSISIMLDEIEEHKETCEQLISNVDERIKSPKRKQNKVVDIDDSVPKKPREEINKNT